MLLLFVCEVLDVVFDKVVVDFEVMVGFVLVKCEVNGLIV